MTQDSLKFLGYPVTGASGARKYRRHHATQLALEPNFGAVVAIRRDKCPRHPIHRLFIRFIRLIGRNQHGIRF